MKAPNRSVQSGSTSAAAAAGWVAAGLALAALAWVWTQRQRVVSAPPPATVISPGPLKSEAREAAAAPLARSVPVESWEVVIGKAMPAVVQVETSRGLGSGFFVSSDKLLTNVHVISGESYVTIRYCDDSGL